MDPFWLFSISDSPSVRSTAAVSLTGASKFSATVCVSASVSSQEGSISCSSGSNGLAAAFSPCIPERISSPSSDSDLNPDMLSDSAADAISCKKDSLSSSATEKSSSSVVFISAYGKIEDAAATAAARKKPKSVLYLIFKAMLLVALYLSLLFFSDILSINCMIRAVA